MRSARSNVALPIKFGLILVLCGGGRGGGRGRGNGWWCFGFSLKVPHTAFSSARSFHLSAETVGGASQEIGIGIDLGTTFSAVAYLKDGKYPTIIPIPENGRTMPSLVAFLDGNREKVVVGKEAAMCQNTEPYCNVKRILGTGGKISPEVQKVVPYLKPSALGKTFKKDSLANQISDAQEHPAMLISSTNSTQLIRPEEISAHILRKLKDAAEAYTGCAVTRAVIGVPAYFHDEQREATKRAAKMAGLGKVKLLREPEAAALAYGLGKQQIAESTQSFEDDDELVLVFDLGGGTFDVSMLHVGPGLTEIISTSGNSKLGGSDFDGRVADHFRKLLAFHGAITKTWPQESLASIVRAAEAARIHLSNNKNVYLALPLSEILWREMKSPKDVFIMQSSFDQLGNLKEAGTNNSTHVLCSLSRRSMEVMCKEELQALLRPVREVAIMSGALLPGDTSRTLVEVALEMEERDSASDALLFQDFYASEEEEEEEDSPTRDLDDTLILQLQKANTKASKKAQQRGRKRARNAAKEERKYQQEKRKIATATDTTKSGSASGRYVDGIKVRDGIAGRPISRVVLVGGATRMPAVGRLVAALTGIVPQKTVNPDEAVALGCAVHVGVLDGAADMGTVLNPMQAAILRALAIKQGTGSDSFVDKDDDDDDYFEEVEIY